MATLLSSIKFSIATLAFVGMIVATPVCSVYAASASGLVHGQGHGLTQTQPSQTTEQTSSNAPTDAEPVQTSAPQASQAAAAAVQAKGNNGTLKIHESGTPVGTENNDPKVCSFNIEGFGFDAGQSGYLQFDVQGGDKPTGTASGTYAFGPTSTSGYYASQYFHLADGHYKATLYGKELPSGQLSDVKAKSKVFKVECYAPTEPTVCPVGTTGVDANSDKKINAGECVTGGHGGNEGSTIDTHGQVLGATVAATKLVNTGDNSVVLMALSSAIIILALLANILVKRRD